MFRAGASTLAKRGLQRTTYNGGPRMSAAFHYSAPREEEAKATEVAADSGFMGTGLSQLYAIPLGVVAAVPILQFNWFLINEELLLSSTFLAFCVVAYTQGGDIMAKGFQEEADSMLKLQNEAENKVIAKLEENLEYMKLTDNIVADYQGVYDLTEASYAKLNAAGQIKPQHDLKAQMEKMMSMIATEEQSVYDKAKHSLMEEATESVKAQFGTDAALKKAALDNALAKLVGQKGGTVDPVQGAFVNFFKAKTAAAKKADDGSEEKAARSAMLTKMNAVAAAEGMFFRFDETTGQLKMEQ